MTKRSSDDRDHDLDDEPDQDQDLDAEPEPVKPDDDDGSLDPDFDSDFEAVVDAVADHDGDLSTSEQEAAAGAVDVAELVDTDDPLSKERRWVALGDLVLEYKFWANPRTQTGLNDEALARLEQSILSRTANVATDDDEMAVRVGIETPIDVVQIQGANGEIVNLVIDGQRRTMAARRSLPADALVPVQDLEPVPVVWTQDLAAKYLTRALDGVATRDGLSGPELAESAARLRNATDADTGKPFTIAVIARTIGRSEAWVSKALAAMDSATPALASAWKSGEITDEQFQIIAGSGAGNKQRSLLAEAKAARASGDKSSARTLIREERERQRQEKAAANAADPKAPKISKGPNKDAQTSLPTAPPRGRLPNQVVDDIIAMATAHPPAHDVCKGIVYGIKVAAGVIDAGDLPHQWTAWLNRCATESQRPKKLAPASGRKTKKK